MTAAALAQAFQKDIRDFRFHTMRVWGSMPIRPMDYTYEIKSAAAEGERLDLLVIDPAEPGAAPLPLSIWGPSDLSLKGDELAVQGARKVSWAGTTYELKGQVLQITDDAGTESGAPRETIALRLERSHG